MASDDDTTIPATDNELLQRVYRLDGPAEAAALYDEWAASYDRDTVAGMGYVAPAIAADRLAELVAPDARVLDAGCGTGLVGAELRSRLPDVVLDGVDLSGGMLERAAAREVYRALSTADLTRPLAVADDAYDAVVCVGTLTRGHLGPEPLEEFARAVRPGGVVVATVLDSIWEQAGFASHVASMADRGVVRLIGAELEPYHQQEDIDCRLLVLQVP